MPLCASPRRPSRYTVTQASGQLPSRLDYWLPSLGLICNDSRSRRLCASPRRPSRYTVTQASGQLPGRRDYWLSESGPHLQRFPEPETAVG